MVDITYSLIGANSDEIDLDGVDYVLNPDFTGFGIPPTSVRIAESAGDGGVWRHTKRAIRDVDLPITILGTDRADVETKLRRLARLTQDAAGATQIVANYSDGTKLRLFVHYVGGAESQWGSDAGMVWNKWVMSFQAPTPFWISSESDSFTIRSGGTGRGLLPQLTKLKVSSAQTLGETTIENLGDVATYPTWRIDGPITDLSISLGDLGFSFNDVVDDGETIFIDTETGRVYDGTGANRYGILNLSPKLFSLPAGLSTVIIEGVETSASTSITCSYSPRYEVIH